MNSRYRHSLGLPFGPLREDEATDLEDALVHHVAFMKRTVYGNMNGPMASILLENLKAEVETMYNEGPPMQTDPDEGFNFEPVEVPEPEVIDFAAAERAVAKDTLSVFLPVPGNPILPVRFLESISDEDMLTFVEAWQAARKEAGRVTILTFTPLQEPNDDPLMHIRFPKMDEGKLDSTVEFLSLPKHEIPAKAVEFCRLVETGTTKDWCRCLWEVHRDHTDIPEGYCTYCREPREAAQHHGGPVLTPSDVEEGYHSFRPRAVRIKETRPACPVHVKEGLILGFFEWMFKDAKDIPPTNDVPGESVAADDGSRPGGALPGTVSGTE